MTSRSRRLAGPVIALWSGMSHLAILLVATLGIAMSSCSRAPDPVAPDKISPAYAHGTFAFAGSVNVLYGTFTQSTWFTGNATPTTFTLRWRTTPTDMGGTLTLGPTGNTLLMDGVLEQRYDDPTMAVAAATGVSAGSAQLLHGLWNGSFGTVLPSVVSSTLIDGTRATITGDADSGYAKTVELNAGKVVKVTVISDPTRSPVEPPEFTDEQFDQILKSTGRPVSAEERASLKANMDQVHAKIREDKTPTTWVTTINITGF